MIEWVCGVQAALEDDVVGCGFGARVGGLILRDDSVVVELLWLKSPCARGGVVGCEYNTNKTG